MKRLHVVAAAIQKGQHILLSRRPDHLHQGGKWEFPGGKVELGEQAVDALIRELQEELTITPTAMRPLIRVHHDYSDLSVLLDVWKVTSFKGEPEGREGQEIGWFESNQLTDLDFPDANHPVVKAVQLPERLMAADQFLEGIDYLSWFAGEGEAPDLAAFREFTEQALLPVYLQAGRAEVSVEQIWWHGGQGLLERGST